MKPINNAEALHDHWDKIKFDPKVMSLKTKNTIKAQIMVEKSSTQLLCIPHLYAVLWTLGVYFVWNQIVKPIAG